MTSKVTINGRTYSGKSFVIVTNDRVIIDGEDVTDKDHDRGILGIKIEGDALNIECDGSVEAQNILGNVRAGGSVNCDNVGGSVNAGGSVNCDDVSGSVTAGGSVRHG